MEVILRNCLFFWLYVDPSFVVGGGVVVEQITIFISTSKGVFVVVVVHFVSHNSCTVPYKLQYFSTIP